GLRLIIRDPELLRRWVCAIAIMVPAVFVPQILWTLSPEIAAAMGVQGEIRPHAVLAIGYGSVIVGDFLAMALSEWLRSRKKASLVFLALGSLVFLKYAFFPAHTVAGFYIWNGLLGLSFGVWVIGAAWAAEQFGTNIRATASATIPNFARGLTIPMNLAYGALKGSGSVTAACVIGGAVFLLAWIGWRGLPETWGKDLDYCEPP
ncbi:MAG: MFS transporter, partial [Alphaproteobacteria bacterium]|nr:MFS transporter [Alphaproteobacteria bacterium]